MMGRHLFRSGLGNDDASDLSYFVYQFHIKSSETILPSVQWLSNKKNKPNIKKKELILPGVSTVES